MICEKGVPSCNPQAYLKDLAIGIFYARMPSLLPFLPVCLPTVVDSESFARVVHLPEQPVYILRFIDRNEQPAFSQQSVLSKNQKRYKSREDKPASVSHRANAVSRDGTNVTSAQANCSNFG